MAVCNAEVAKKSAGTSRQEIINHINLMFAGTGSLSRVEIDRFNQGWDALISHGLLAEQNKKLYRTNFSDIIIAYQTIYTSSGSNEEYKDHKLLEDLLEKIENDARFNPPDDSPNSIKTKTINPIKQKDSASPIRWGLATLIILFAIIYLSR